MEHSNYKIVSINLKMYYTGNLILNTHVDKIFGTIY